MNQLTLSSSIGNTVNQYWQLINIMLFSLKVVGYIVVLFLGIAFISAALSVVFPAFSVLASASFSIVSLVGFFGLPIGVLVLTANRTVNLMANIKQKLFVITLLFTLSSVLINTLFSVSPEQAMSKVNLILIWLLFCPLYFMLTIVIASKDVGLSMLSPVLMIVFAQTAFTHLSGVHVILLSIGIFSTWCLFYRWWTKFVPSEGVVKSVWLKIDNSKVQELPWEKILQFRASKISTAMGTFLLGYSDHVLFFIKRIFLIFFFSLLCALYATSGFKIDELGGDALRIAVFVACVYSFILMSMDFYSKKMMLNIKRAWLVFFGNRGGLFLYMESFFWRGLGLLVAFNFTLLTLFLLLTQQLQYLIYVVVGILIMSLIVTLDFYWDIYCYRKDQQVGHINFRKAGVSAFLIVTSCYYLVEKYSTFNTPEIKDAVALLVALLAVGLLNPVRKLCMKRFKLVDI
jgi:hypothetical protein